MNRKIPEEDQEQRKREEGEEAEEEEELEIYEDEEEEGEEEEYEEEYEEEEAPTALDMEITGITTGQVQDSYQPLAMQTNRGTIYCRYYAVPNARGAVIWAGGVGGDFDSPAKDLYPRLCQKLAQEGIASLRVSYREASNLEESVLDVLAGLVYLESEGVQNLCLVGHSLGGAVVIQAGTASESVRGVVTLSTQSYGADAASDLPEDCGLLLIHGQKDTVLPAVGSESIYKIAHEPKRLELFPNAGHSLDPVASEVETMVHDWIVSRMS